MKKRKWTQKEVSDWLKKHHALIYFNPSDKNLFVRKYYGIGWIMNLGNPWAYVAVIGAVVVLLLITRIL